MAKMYDLIAINERTGRVEKLTAYPATHHEAVTMKNKFNPHRDVRIQLKQIGPKCNFSNIAKKIRGAKRMPVASDLRPLRNHMLKLAANSARHGYCARAGIEIAQAKRLATKHPR